MMGIDESYGISGPPFDDPWPEDEWTQDDRDERADAQDHFDNMREERRINR